MNEVSLDYSLYLWLSFLMTFVIFAAHIIQAISESRQIHRQLRSKFHASKVGKSANNNISLYEREQSIS